MRINLKVALCLIVIAAVFTTFSYWTKCGDAPIPSESLVAFPKMPKSQIPLGKYPLQELLKDDLYGEDLSDVTPNGNHLSKAPDDRGTCSEDIDCQINGEYTVLCRQVGHEVYVPFSFLHKYFEVYGKVNTVDGRQRFDWQHSYSKYYQPKSKYDPRGVFMNFENFNVEGRDRVKCISAIEGVPVSTQWDARGYLYPIQIAQFGLSHFSKNLTEPQQRSSILEDGKVHQAKWSTPDGTVDRIWDDEAGSEVLRFSTSESLQSVGISLSLESVQDLVLSLHVRLESNGSITVVVEDRELHERYHLHYVCSSVYISLEGSHIYYGMGPRRHWGRLTRDVAVDLRKGLALTKSKRRLKSYTNKLRGVGIVLRGQGALDNFTVSSANHVNKFFDAADWLLVNQDENGGWPIPVERKFSSTQMGNLAPGWYSAMAQGQALSLLTRAYHATKDDHYLEAALRATKLFEVPSERNGIVARFMDKYLWYEEYPTIPSSFVLNGFIYSLIGLYDVKMACEEDDDDPEGGRGRQAALLYEEGMKSLKTLLPLFDTGISSYYDLRHVTLGIVPNLARWDYHTTHIGQLLLLATIDDADILKNTALRWIEYMKGKRAPHN